jgi:hypothetical protein
MTRGQAVKELQKHADVFLSGNDQLWSFVGPFSETFDGKMAEEYRHWSKRAYELIRQLGDQQ